MVVIPQVISKWEDWSGIKRAFFQLYLRLIMQKLVNVRSRNPDAFQSPENTLNNVTVTVKNTENKKE